MSGKAEKPIKVSTWSRIFYRASSPKRSSNPGKATDEFSEMKTRLTKWSLGILNDKEADEVPGESIDAGRLDS